MHRLSCRFVLGHLRLGFLHDLHFRHVRRRWFRQLLELRRRFLFAVWRFNVFDMSRGNRLRQWSRFVHDLHLRHLRNRRIIDMHILCCW